MTHGIDAAASIAREFGLRTAIGMWVSSDLASNETEIANGIALAEQGYVDILVVENEVLLRGDLTEAQLLGYMARVHAAVPEIPMATADTYAIP